MKDEKEEEEAGLGEGYTREREEGKFLWHRQTHTQTRTDDLREVNTNKQGREERKRKGSGHKQTMVGEGELLFLIVVKSEREGREEGKGWRGGVVTRWCGLVGAGRVDR